MFTLFSFIKFTLTPYKTLQFYKNYFTTISNIQSNNKIYKLKIHFILILSTISQFHTVYFYLFPAKNSLEIFMHYDAFYFIVPLNGRHIIVFFNILNSIYFYSKLYFNPCLSFINFSNEILFFNKSSFLKVNFLINRNEFLNIQRFAFLVLNFTQIYTAGLGKFLML